VTLLQLQNCLKSALRDAARAEFGIGLDQIASEVPPKTELGDLAFPVAFELAKQIKQKTGEKQAPRTIAEALKPSLEAVEEVARVEVAAFQPERRDEFAPLDWVCQDCRKGLTFQLLSPLEMREDQLFHRSIGALNALAAVIVHRSQRRTCVAPPPEA